MEAADARNSCDCEIDERVYPLAAVLKAAYTFLDRCYLFLSHNGDGQLQVRLKPKPGSQAQLADLAGEFFNELLNQSLRYQLAAETRNLRELIMARALYSGCLEMASAEPFSAAEGGLALADPDGIGQDWFEQQSVAG